VVPSPPPAPAEICTDAAVAAGRTAAGIDVVLILPEGVAVAARRRGPGRLAVLVGDAGRDADRAAAAAMAAELFGA